jgi:hypothetical protein
MERSITAPHTIGATGSAFAATLASPKPASQCTTCNGGQVDLRIDPANCAACGNQCVGTCRTATANPARSQNLALKVVTLAGVWRQLGSDASSVKKPDCVAEEPSSSQRRWPRANPRCTV